MRNFKTLLILCFVFIIPIFFKSTYAGTILGDSQAGMVRFLYFLINGPPSTGYPNACGGECGGPENGLLGMIREINGADALGGGLSSCGYTACSDIPSTGSCSMTDSDGTFVMTFETPSKTIPSSYTGGGGNFDKRVSVTKDNVHFMDTEFNCDTTVGWMRFAEPSEISGGSLTTARHMEVYYDTETSTATKMEMAMYRESTSSEYFLAKFQTNSATNYEFWITRAATDGGNQGFRIAVNGNTSTKVANVHMQFKTNMTDTETGVSDSGDITSTGDLQCIDFTDADNPVSSSDCGSLSVSTGGTPIIDTDGDFSIENTGNSAKLKAAFSAL